MKATLWAIGASTLVMLVAQKPVLALYNGSLGTHPNNQGWSYLPSNPFANPPTANASRALTGTGTTLDTTSNDNIQSGYSFSGQTLNRTAGYNLRFDLRLLTEDHSNPNASNNPGTDAIADRAGLSIIALSSDGQGIELGFWTDRIWAQEDGAIKADPTNAPTGTRFTQAEGANFNTQAAMTQYDLSILGNTYYLYSNGNYTVPLLTGRLRNYVAEGFPYNTPNLIYIGDNTTSARGSFTLNQVAFSNSATVPVPFAFNPLFGVSLFALSRLRQITRKQAKDNL